LLAYGAPPADPPRELRDRILSTARAERPNVVPLRPRWAVPAAAAAAVAVAASVALAIWAVSLSRTVDRDRSTAATQQSLARILADPNARHVQLSGASGSVVITGSGEAALVISGLERARPGTTYEAWVIRKGQPLPAGTFDGGASSTLVRLTPRVETGSSVAVTVEPGSGSQAPTTQPIFQARA
jgi:Anti-sigma-K factor rskA